MPGAPPDRVTPARWARPALYAAGLALLAAAVWTVARHSGELAGARAAAAAAPPWLVAAVALLPLVNWALTSLVFWLLTRAYGRVGPGEMAALIGSAWLLNMLPLKPGLVARVAYHRAISGIPVWLSLLVVLLAVVSGAAGILATVLAAVALDEPLRAGVPPARLGLVAAALGAASLGLIVYAQRRRARLGHAAPLPIPALAAAAALRALDTLVWALRYWLVFRLLGRDEGYGACVVIAGVSQVASQLPVSLGLREWLVGASAAALASRGEAALPGAVQGLTADLVCRAAEIACALPVGLVSYAWVARRLRRAATADPSPPGT
jgi:hypothetical protein